MLVFWNAGLVILANPKTGSEALQDALWPHADSGTRFPPFYRHMNRAWFEKSWTKILTPEDKGRFQTFAVVREPVDWLSSWYRYRQRDDIAGQPASTRGVSFADFVESWLSDTPLPCARVGRQSRFCADKDGAIAVDHIYAYEAPRAIRSFLEDRLGQRVEMARRNVSPDMETDLPDAVRRRLQTEAAAEFELHAIATR